MEIKGVGVLENTTFSDWVDRMMLYKPLKVTDHSVLKADGPWNVRCYHLGEGIGVAIIRKHTDTMLKMLMKFGTEQQWEKRNQEEVDLHR